LTPLRRTTSAKRSLLPARDQRANGTFLGKPRLKHSKEREPDAINPPMIHRLELMRGAMVW
jgi:hypothetical protein